MKSGEDQTEELKNFEQSVFKSDFCIEKLKRELGVLIDAIHVALPHVKKVTSIRTISEAMCTYANNQMLTEVHKHLRLYFTIPITSSTSESSFSALKRLLTYLRSTMTEKRLNNCFLLHVHNNITDAIDLVRLQRISSRATMNAEHILECCSVSRVVLVS